MRARALAGNSLQLANGWLVYFVACNRGRPDAVTGRWKRYFVPYVLCHVVALIIFA